MSAFWEGKFYDIHNLNREKQAVFATFNSSSLTIVSKVCLAKSAVVNCATPTSDEIKFLQLLINFFNWFFEIVLKFLLKLSEKHLSLRQYDFP